MLAVQELYKYNGQEIRTDDADYGQCTAVPHRWELDNGWPVVLGNAKDTLANAPSNFYVKTMNAPANYPLPGAIMVWGPSWGGGYGHTAVVVSANANLFTCIEQNDGDNGLVHEATHNYAGVEGWFYPRVVAPQAAPTGFPRVVPIHSLVNVRTEPHLSAPIVAQLHPGTCLITGEVTGDEATFGSHSTNQWGVTQNKHYFTMGATM